MQFRGAHALVTGANRGLGSHFVEALLDRGAERVYAAARRIDTLADAVESHGERVVPVRLDVTNVEAVRHLADDLPDVDIVVSNAGQTCKFAVLQEQAEREFRSALEVNFFGPLGLVRAFAPHLASRRGGILFVQSLAALVISRSSPIYSASKAAAMMLATGVRAELRTAGVTVTSTFPGFIDTDMTTGLDIPKASPRSVADRSLDAFAAGRSTVFPDRLAELVENAVTQDMAAVLDDPQAVMTRLIREFRLDPIG
jgi:NAD(P)-dependent dehydrogenase (short-subunit alcohol dehydrogenase family)